MASCDAFISDFLTVNSPVSRPLLRDPCSQTKQKIKLIQTHIDVWQVTNHSLGQSMRLFQVTCMAVISGHSVESDHPPSGVVMVWPLSLSRDRKWPPVTKCTHSRVVGLRLEVNLVFVFFLHSGLTFECSRYPSIFFWAVLSLVGCQFQYSACKDSSPTVWQCILVSSGTLRIGLTRARPQVIYLCRTPSFTPRDSGEARDQTLANTSDRNPPTLESCRNPTPVYSFTLAF